MRPKHCLCVLLIVSFCVSCSSPTFTPIAQSGQQVDYRAGQPTIISRKQNLVALTLLPPRVEDHTNFLVTVVNRSGASATIDTANVTAESGNHRLTVFTSDRLQRYENLGNAFAVIGAGFGGAVRSANAAQPATSYASGTVYNQYGAPVANYGGVARTYDPAAVAVAQSTVNADTAAQVGGIQNEHQARSAQIGALLRRTTVHPGEQINGVIELNNTWMHDPIRLHVDFAGEEHSFAFHMAK